MKKIMLPIAISFIALLFVSKLEANINAPDKTPDLKKYLEKNVKYPSEAKDKLLQGFVVLEFTLKQDGTIEINAINSNDSGLLEHVKSQLNTLKWSQKEDYGKKYYYRFDFKLV